jgi:hypothetical protein
MSPSGGGHLVPEVLWIFTGLFSPFCESLRITGLFVLFLLLFVVLEIKPSASHILNNHPIIQRILRDIQPYVFGTRALVNLLSTKGILLPLGEAVSLQVLSALTVRGSSWVYSSIGTVSGEAGRPAISPHHPSGRCCREPSHPTLMTSIYEALGTTGKLNDTVSALMLFTGKPKGQNS